MHRLPSAALLLLCLAPRVSAQESGPKHDAEPAHADHAVAGGGVLPAGWSARPDEGDLTNVKVVPMGGGSHVTLGPAVILYRESTKGSGPFHTLATFTQTKKLEHAEGYGLFFGGQALDGPGQQYTYFLVRDDGTFLVKRRDGDKTTEVTKGWVAHPAVHKADAKGSSTNLLEIEHKRDPSKFVFLANGQPVYTADAKAMNADGVVGIRANHNLDLQIEGFDVHR